MKEEDRKRFGVALFWLASKYPLGRDGNGQQIARKLDKAFLDDYFQALKDLPILKLELGAKHHYGHEQFFPSTPAALRKSCEQVPAPREGWLPPPPDQKLLGELPAEENAKRARAITELLNSKFGSTFKVGERGEIQSGVGGG